MLAMAAKTLPDQQWIRARMQDVAFEAASFDAVVCWDALFHLPRTEHIEVIDNISRWLAADGWLMVSSGGVVGERGFTDTMFDHEFFYDSLPPRQMEAAIVDAGFQLLISEMCNQPDGGRDRGKWAIVAQKAASRK